MSIPVDRINQEIHDDAADSSYHASVGEALVRNELIVSRSHLRSARRIAKRHGLPELQERLAGLIEHFDWLRKDYDERTP